MEDDPRKAAGLRLRKARESKGFSIRAAARAAELWLQESNPSAKFSEGLWRNMEQGERSVAGGLKVPANPFPRNVYAAAKVVGLDGDDLLAMYEQATEEDAEDEPPAPPAPGPPAGDGIHPAVRSLRVLLDWVETLPPDEQAEVLSEAREMFSGDAGPSGHEHRAAS